MLKKQLDSLNKRFHAAGMKVRALYEKLQASQSEIIMQKRNIDDAKELEIRLLSEQNEQFIIFKKFCKEIQGGDYFPHQNVDSNKLNCELLKTVFCDIKEALISLKKEKEETFASLISANETLNDIQKEKQKLLDNQKEIKKNNINLKNELSTANGIIGALKSQIEELKEKIDKMETKSSSQIDEIADQKQINSNLSFKLEYLTKTMNEEQKKNDKLSSMIDTQKHNLEEEHLKLIEISDTNKRYSIELEAIKTELFSTSAKKSELEDKNINLMSTVKDLEFEAKLLTDKNELLSKESKISAEKNDILTLKIEETTKKLHESEKSLLTKVVESRSKEVENESLNQTIKEKQNEISALSESINEWQTIETKNKDHIAQLKIELKERIDIKIF